MARAPTTSSTGLRGIGRGDATSNSGSGRGDTGRSNVDAAAKELSSGCTPGRYAVSY